FDGTTHFSNVIAHAAAFIAEEAARHLKDLKDQVDVEVDSTGNKLEMFLPDGNKLYLLVALDGRNWSIYGGGVGTEKVSIKSPLKEVAKEMARVAKEGHLDRLK
ncbi:MAG: hypothetical protein ABEI52_07735, partial [Halobacteriaceae archaeon]